jgi:hypothetical protein
MLNEILLIILSLIIVLIPSLKLFCCFYYTFGSFVLITILFLIVLFLKIQFKIKIAILACLLLFFKNTLSTIGKTITEIYKLAYVDTLKNRNNDSKLRNVVKNIYTPTLILKTNFKKLPTIPTIFVSNYCNDRLENLSCILIPKDIAILMRDGLKKTTKLDKLVKWPIFTKEKNNYENTKTEITKHINHGRSIFAYITKYPLDIPNVIHTVRTGLFSIAKELDIPVTLVAIDFIDTQFHNIQKQNFHLEIGDTFKVDNIQQAVYKSRKYYKKTLTKFMQQKYIFIN